MKSKPGRVNQLRIKSTPFKSDLWGVRLNLDNQTISLDTATDLTKIINLELTPVEISQEITLMLIRKFVFVYIPVIFVSIFIPIWIYPKDNISYGKNNVAFKGEVKDDAWCFPDNIDTSPNFTKRLTKRIPPPGWDLAAITRVDYDCEERDTPRCEICCVWQLYQKTFDIYTFTFVWSLVGQTAGDMTSGDCFEKDIADIFGCGFANLASNANFKLVLLLHIPDLDDKIPCEDSALENYFQDDSQEFTTGTNDPPGS